MFPWKQRSGADEGEWPTKGTKDTKWSWLGREWFGDPLGFVNFVIFVGHTTSRSPVLEPFGRPSVNLAGSGPSGRD